MGPLWQYMGMGASSLQFVKNGTIRFAFGKDRSVVTQYREKIPKEASQR